MSPQEASQHEQVKTHGVEKLSVTLPEDVVEKILTMVPFPQVFKAGALSKSWQARFLQISPQDDEGKMHLAATCFQKEVCERSTNWKTLCPVFVLDFEQGFIAYDRTTQSWPRMPSLSFLPCNILRSSRSTLQIDGSLLLMSDVDYSWETASKHVASMHVANFLTRRWKQLPQPPFVEDESYLFQKLVSQTSSEAYHVIVFYSGRDYYRAQIYDSTSNAWRSCKTVVKDVSSLSRPTYFNGVLYMVLGQNPRNLLAFNVTEGTFEELELSGNTMGMFDVDLVICKGSLLMTVKGSVFGKTVQVLRIDLGLRKLFEVAQGPPANCDFGELATGCVSDKSWTDHGRATSDGDCIFFPLWHFNHGMVVYNVHENEWSHMSFPGDVVGVHDSVLKLDVTSFQPSLNTFLAV